MRTKRPLQAGEAGVGTRPGPAGTAPAPSTLARRAGAGAPSHRTAPSSPRPATRARASFWLIAAYRVEQQLLCALEARRDLQRRERFLLGLGLHARRAGSSRRDRSAPRPCRRRRSAARRGTRASRRRRRASSSASRPSRCGRWRRTDRARRRASAPTVIGALVAGRLARASTSCAPPRRWCDPRRCSASYSLIARGRSFSFSASAAISACGLSGPIALGTSTDGALQRRERRTDRRPPPAPGRARAARCSSPGFAAAAAFSASSDARVDRLVGVVQRAAHRRRTSRRAPCRRCPAARPCRR